MLCVGQHCFGMVRKRRLEHRKKKVSESRGQETLRDLCDVQCKTLGDTQAQDWRKRKHKQGKARAEDIGTTRRSNCNSHRMYGGIGQQGDRKMDQGHHAMEQQFKKENWAYSEDIAFVVE